MLLILCTPEASCSTEGQEHPSVEGVSFEFELIEGGQVHLQVNN